MPLAIGFVSLLMITSVAVNELIIKALRSANQIEAADRAFFIAEAGVEDALYELSPHFGGYQTPNLGINPDDENVRKLDFGGSVRWKSAWTIRSHEDVSNGTIMGEILSGQKLIISLFNDANGNVTKSKNEINVPDPINDIQTLTSVGNLSITFQVPESVRSNIAFNGGLAIDNDGDQLVNEDGIENTGTCVGLSPNDWDCDGKDNEDSHEDPVIYWKLMDDSGRTLSPIKGCLGETDNTFPMDGSELCEKNFTSPDIFMTLPSSAEGITDEGDPQTISDFISGSGDKTKLQMEFLIVAPMQQADEAANSKVEIPYLEYTMVTDDPNLPLPYFTIKSDGYYRDFKQSINTVVTPKTAVPLFDFTIIQQQ